MIKIAYLSELPNNDQADLRDQAAYLYFCKSFKQITRLFSESSIDALIIDQSFLSENLLNNITTFRFSIKPPIFISYNRKPEIDEFIKLTKFGVDSFVLKPLQLSEIREKIQAYLIPCDISNSHDEENSNWPGKSLIMRNLKEEVKRYSNSSYNVLITGETGCGKGFVAKELHRISDRSDEPFCDINCASIPESLFESELFGTCLGAFTGSKERSGLLDYSAKGTVFLDEIGEISPFLQVKLLKVIEDRFYFPLGSTKAKKLQSRVITATNINLPKRIKKGGFRKDLYYRLNTLSLRVPPLRKHKEDIPQMVTFFLRKFRSTKKITHEALKKLYHYSWPGNIRELISTLQRAETLCMDSPWIESIHIRF